MTRLPGTAIHATKARWVDRTIADGLVRPSAAWFLLEPTGARRQATFAAAIWLALGPSGRQRLCANPTTPYRDVFHRQPDLLPALVVFFDRPTGTEVWHRYHWLGGHGREPLTDPYTKAVRAGRTVGPGLPAAGVQRVTVDDVAAAEADLRQDGARWWDDVPLLRKVSDMDTVDTADTGDGREAEPAAPTRLGVVCTALGRLLDRTWPATTAEEGMATR
jgi:hypothetical protein